MVKAKKGKNKKKKSRKTSGKKQIEYENKLLRNLFIGVGIFILIVLILFWVFSFASKFEYEGVKFKIVKEGNLILYQTSLPVIHNGQKATYNFYLRNDPRKLADIYFEGGLFMDDNMVINSTEDFNCDGDGVIAIANLVKLYEIIGTKVIKDENATCDPELGYAFLQITSANQTNIEKFGPICYRLNIYNCEILKATERFMLETLVEVNKIL